jgi:hypothetical protein
MSGASALAWRLVDLNKVGMIQQCAKHMQNVKRMSEQANM